jgi:hypothetical protein
MTAKKPGLLVASERDEVQPTTCMRRQKGCQHLLGRSIRDRGTATAQDEDGCHRGHRRNLCGIWWVEGTREARAYGQDGDAGAGIAERTVPASRPPLCPTPPTPRWRWSRSAPASPPPSRARPSGGAPARRPGALSRQSGGPQPDRDREPGPTPRPRRLVELDVAASRVTQWSSASRRGANRPGDRGGLLTVEPRQAPITAGR